MNITFLCSKNISTLLSMREGVTNRFKIDDRESTETFGTEDSKSQKAICSDFIYR